MSRLYTAPVNRSVFEESYECFPMKMIGKPNLEDGDKIILSQSAFRQVSHCKLEYPLLFELKNPKKPRLSTTSTKKEQNIQQYCGVLEFSAEEDAAYVPSWIMKNLGIREGGKINLTSIIKVPSGTFVRFQPHDVAFIDALETLGGPKYFLESALRQFSVLNKGGKIVIKCGSTPFILTVLDTKPANVVSIVGSVDIEVDFAAAVNDLTVKSPNKTSVSSNFSPTNVTSSASEVEYNAFGDVISKSSVVSKDCFTDNAVQEATPEFRLAISYIPDVAASVPADSLDTSGTRRLCGSCRKYIATTTWTMHSIHCSKNYLICKQCLEVVKRVDMDLHTEQRHVTQICKECKQEMSYIALKKHLEDGLCSSKPVNCELCNEIVKFSDLEAHLQKCGERTHACKDCNLTFPVREARLHDSMCSPKCLCGERILKAELIAHKNLFCPNRVVECKFCHLNVPFSDANHALQCGSRTAPCDYCSRYIILRDMDQHVNSLCQWPPIAPVISVASKASIDSEITSLSSKLEDSSIIPKFKSARETAASLSRQKSKNSAPVAPSKKPTAKQSSNRNTGNINIPANYGESFPPEDLDEDLRLAVAMSQAETLRDSIETMVQSRESKPKSASSRPLSSKNVSCPLCATDFVDMEDAETHLVTSHITDNSLDKVLEKIQLGFATRAAEIPSRSSSGFSSRPSSARGAGLLSTLLARSESNKIVPTESSKNLTEKSNVPLGKQKLDSKIVSKEVVKRESLNSSVNKVLDSSKRATLPSISRK